MKNFFITLIICLIVISEYGASSENAGWKLVVNKNGIRVYTRPVQGSEVEEFRAVVTIETSLETLGNIMKDIPAQPQWIADCIHAETLKKTGKNSLLIYSIYKTPWPVADRDTVIRTVTEVDPGKQWFSIRMDAEKSSLVPVKKDLVRIPRMKGSWTFRKTGSRSVAVTYSLMVDPGGSIPAWLANRTSRNSPYETLIGLKKMAGLKKYEN